MKERKNESCFEGTHNYEIHNLCELNTGIACDEISNVVSITLSVQIQIVSIHLEDVEYPNDDWLNITDIDPKKFGISL